MQKISYVHAHIRYQKRPRLWFCRWHCHGQARVTLHKCECPAGRKKNNANVVFEFTTRARWKECWCRSQLWIRWFHHARVSAHKYFDDGADCSELCGRVCAWGQQHKFTRSSSTLSLKYTYFILCFIPSCHLYKYDRNIHFLEKVELASSEKVTAVFQHWFFVESYWHWILRCVHLVMLQKICLSLKDVRIWNMRASQTHAFPPSALSTGRRAPAPKSLDKMLWTYRRR